MVTILGGRAKCPQCGGHQFSNPREPDPNEKITCLQCGHVARIEDALNAGLTKPQASGSENLVDKDRSK